MAPNLRSIRPLDAVIVGVAALLLVVSGFLGWSVWSHNQQVEEATPISRAITELEGMIKRKPKDVGLRLELAQAYTVAGRNDLASEQYTQVLKLQKNNVSALSGLGFAASLERDWEKAESYWRRVIKILDKQPNVQVTKPYEKANFYLGTALLEQKKYEDAVGYFKAALRANRTASDTHFLLAAAYRGLGADDQYKSELEFTLAFDPLMPEANYEYGNILLKEGDIPGAAQHFRIAVDQAPDRDEPRAALEQLGSFEDRMDKALSLSKGEPEKALVEARVAVAIEPRDVEGLMLLGGLYEKTGDKEAAAESYRTILGIDPGHDAAQEALERIDK